MLAVSADASAGAQSFEQEADSLASQTPSPHTGLPGAQLPPIQEVPSGQGPQASISPQPLSQLPHAFARSLQLDGLQHCDCQQVVPAVQPQSLGQVLHDSPDSHRPLPHAAGHEPQSAGQLPQDSLPSHWPFPQGTGHFPQSAGQLLQDSPASHCPSPQGVEHLPQSRLQSTHDSAPVHAPSPHFGPGLQAAWPPLAGSQPYKQTSAIA